MRYVAIRSEGGLIPYDLLDKIANEDAPGQKPSDFGLPKGRRLTDEISRVWADAQSLWSNFKRRRESLSDRDPYGTSITRSWIGSLLGDVDMLGFDLKLQASAVVVNNSTYAISHRSGEGEDAIPVHIEGLKIDLDRRLHTKLRTSPQAMVQDFLNNNEPTVWGIVTNGLSVRILRNSSRTSRPTYLEFDLENIVEGNRFNEFGLFYRVCHRSRFPLPGRELADCFLERYYLDSIEQGLRVRDKLREGVEETLKIIGTGFLQHPRNEILREKVSSGRLSAIQFHRQLLLLVYRLLFLMVAEERGLIVSGGENVEENQKIYDEWYSITRLRDRAAQIIDTSPFGDVWQGLQQTFSLFEYGLDTNPLGIPPLNGDLFHQEHAIPNLKGTELYNHELLRAIRHLSLFKDANVQQRVNYSALDVEELGSVYESLLDYQPVLEPSEKGLIFELRTGVERKSTGSYYTRPELVHELVESALVPVLEERIAEAEKASEGKNLVEEQKVKIATILNMTVCDPACGSGHFLLAAARRLGKELARIRTGEDEPRPEDFHLAVRDIISHCVYGVDLNPLAVDLCKLALWLEGHWAGKPLSFLDHRIRCGNSLVGVFDPEVLTEGVPDEAFTAVTGDDKKVAATFKKRNKQERTSKQRDLSFEPDDHSDEYAKAKRELAEITEDSAAAVRRKAELYGSWRAGMQHSHDEAVADLWTAQYYQHFHGFDDPAICTTAAFLNFAKDLAKQPQKVAAAQSLAIQNRFFHWYMEFPEVFQNGGFDVVLGNPPWDRIKIDEEEYWGADRYISAAKNKAERGRRLDEYRVSDDPVIRQRFAEFEATKHSTEASSKFVRACGRFPLTAVGDVNTYALFAELTQSLTTPKGRSGLILPTGIATDNTTKAFFNHIIEEQLLVRIIGFENEAFIFPAVHHSFKFCAFTLTGGAAKVKVADLAFLCRRFEDVQQSERHFSLAAPDIAVLNPNTHTCPVFRTGADADLTKKIYAAVPVLVNDAREDNEWGVSFMRVFDMNKEDVLEQCAKWDVEKDSDLSWAPMYEAKMIYQFDHRYGTYEGATQAQLNVGSLPRPTLEQKASPAFRVRPRYLVQLEDVKSRLPEWKYNWLFGFRDITSSVVERTAIATIIPLVATDFTIRLLFPNQKPVLVACLLANFNSIPFDYLARQNIAGNHLSDYITKQLPVLTPFSYTPDDVRFIVPRVAELVCSAVDVSPFLGDIWESEFGEAPDRGFGWDPNKRSIIRAELDAYYAHLYGLTREELRYILDPKAVFGETFPSETFRVLKEKETKEFGEYRTQRLVLGAFDDLSRSERFGAAFPSRPSTIAPQNKNVLASVTQ